jgi:hypothetical protein
MRRPDGGGTLPSRHLSRSGGRTHLDGTAVDPSAVSVAEDDGTQLLGKRMNQIGRLPSDGQMISP